MSDDLNTEIKIGADASGVEAGVGRAKRSLADLGASAKKAGKDAGDGVGSIGAGGDKAARDVERATKSMQGSLQRLLAEQKAGAKGSREYYEALADTRGISRSAIKPILDQIDAAKSKTLQAKDAAESWTASLGKVGPLVAAAFSGAAITGFLGKVVSVQREFDVLNSSLKTVTGSSAAAEREMAWLKDFAKETPFGLAQATQGFVKMKALGLDPTRAALTSFGNTASAMGKDLNQMIEAVADASTGEFERLKEFGIKAKKEGDNVSLTFQGVTTTIRNSAADITKYLENIGNVSFGGAMEERAKTLDGTIAALGDTWDELFRTVSTNNVGGLIFDSVTLANGALEDATTILRALGGAAQDAGRDTGALSTIQSGIATVFETVAVLGANLKFVLVGIGNEIGGLAAQVAQAAQFNFSGVAAIRRAMVADAEAARKEIDATTARILNARKAQEEYARYATRNASAATDPRRVDLGGSAPRATGGVSSGTAKAVKEAISEYDKLIKKLSDELPKAAAEAEAAQMGYNKSQTEFLALAGSPAWASFSNAQRAVVASMFEGKIASEQAGEAAKELSKAYAEAAAERIKTIQSMERAADSLQSQNDALREEIELIGLSTEQQTLVLQQRNDVIILTKEATLAELERQSAITGTQTRVKIALASEIDALKERNALLGAKGVKNAAVDAAKSAADEWKKTSDKINDTLTDALMRGFESGKDFAKNMRDTVINMFKTMVLRPVINAIVNPIAGAAAGALGFSGAASAASGGGGIMGMASNASSAYNMVAGGGAFAGALGSGFTMGMGGLGSMGAALEGGAAMLGSATGVSSALAGIGQIAGALGPIALGIGAIVGLSKLFGAKGTQEYGGVASYSAATGVQTSSTQGAFGTGFGGVAANEQILGNVSGIAQSIVTALDATAKTFGQTVGYEAAAGFASDFGKEATWGGLRIALQGMDLVNWDATRESKWAPREFDSGEEGYKQYLAEIAQDTRKVLLDMDLPTWADEIITSIGDAASMDQLSAALQQIGAIQTTFTNLGKAIEGFADMTDSAFTALMKASGGIEALSANAGTYYENFYSEAEKTATVTRSVSDALAAVGLAMPATRDEFRALVESQIALGEGSTQAVAALLGVSGAFASVVPAAEQAAEAISQIMQNLLRDRGRLEADLLRAQGNIAGADAANRLLDIAGYTEAEVALYDYNAALRAQISGLEAASAASANALQRIREQAESARQGALDEVDSAYAALQRSVDAQRSLVQETINDTRAVFETLRTNVRSLYGEVGGTAAMQAAQGRAFIGQALSAAQTTGYLPDGQQLQEAIGAVRSEMQSKVYASQAEADYERLVLAGELKDLQDLSGDQLTEAEKQLKALDNILDNARAQVDALKGVDTSVMSVEAAIQRLADALLEAKNPGLMDKYGMSAERLRELQGTYGDSINSAAGGTQYDKYKMYSAMLQDAAAGSVTFDEMRAVVESVAGAQTDADWKYLQQGSARVEYASSIMPAIQETSAENKAGWYNNLADVGLTDAQIRETVEAQLGAQTPEDWDYLKKLAGVPAFAVGTNYVPRDMLAQIHEGEAIIPKAYNPAAGGAGNSTARLEALVEGLTKEVQRLQAVVNDGNREQRRTANAVNGNPDMPMLVQTI